MSDEDASDARDGRRFEALREAVESEAYLEEGGIDQGVENGIAERPDGTPESPGNTGPASSDTASSDGQDEAGSGTPSPKPESPGGRDTPDRGAPTETTVADASERANPEGVRPDPEASPASSDSSGRVEGVSPEPNSGATAGSPESADSSEGSPPGPETPWSSVDVSERTGGDSTPEALHEVSSLLLLRSGGDVESDPVCSELLYGDSDDRNVVIVAFADTPTERLSTLRDGVDESNEIVVIDVGDMANTASATDLDSERWANVTVRPMPNPSDASRLGMVIDDVVSEWAEFPHDTRVCFHTLSGLLEYMDEETAFRFLHTLLRRFAAVNAVAHFHMDTEAQSIETLRTLQVLFDEVVSVSEDGELSAIEM